MAQIAITVNGKVRKAVVEPRMLLVHFLRDHLRLTGTHIGCDTSQCGACTVLIDGRSAKSCTVFAVQADGSTVTTIEGLAPEGQLHPLQTGFLGGTRPPVRLLHAGDDYGGGHAARRQSRIRPSARFARASPVISADAPATSTSSTQSKTPQNGADPMATSPVLPKLVGQRVKRREDPRLIQGRATYVDDVALVGMQYLAFKRSDVAHGRILDIDTSAAEAIEGVEAVFTGAQIAEILEPMPIGTPRPSPEHRAVAVDTVRYTGEPVAVVVARDRYIARDAPTRSW